MYTYDHMLRFTEKVLNSHCHAKKDMTLTFYLLILIFFTFLNLDFFHQKSFFGTTTTQDIGDLFARRGTHDHKSRLSESMFLFNKGQGHTVAV